MVSVIEISGERIWEHFIPLQLGRNRVASSVFLRVVTEQSEIECQIREMSLAVVLVRTGRLERTALRLEIG